MSRGLFVTGTGTGVGKTFVAALIAHALRRAAHRVGVYKPAASGCEVVDGELCSADAQILWEAAGRPGELSRVCPQRYAAPLAVHLAARAEGRTVDGKLLRSGLDYWQERSDVVLVEGAGGLMSPIADDAYNADLAADFGFPLVVVAANVLGTINATLQTLIAASAFREELSIAGVVLNALAATASDPSAASNRAELEARCVPPVLAAVGWQATVLDELVDWYALAEPGVAPEP